MRITALALIVALFTFSASDAFALSTVAATAAKVDQENLQWQKVAVAIPLGTKVKLQTLDGKRVSGTLLSVDEESVQVKRNTRRPEAAVTVMFDNISNLQRDNGGGLNWAKALGIGLGAGAGVANSNEPTQVTGRQIERRLRRASLRAYALNAPSEDLAGELR